VFKQSTVEKKYYIPVGEDLTIKVVAEAEGPYFDCVCCGVQRRGESTAISILNSKGTKIFEDASIKICGECLSNGGKQKVATVIRILRTTLKEMAGYLRRDEMGMIRDCMALAIAPVRTEKQTLTG